MKIGNVGPPPPHPVAQHLQQFHDRTQAPHQGAGFFSAKHVISTFSNTRKTTNCTTCKHRNVRKSCCHHCHLPFSHTLYVPPTQDASHLLNDVTFLGLKIPTKTNLHLSPLVGPASCMMFCQVRAFCRGAKFEAPEGCKACGKFD